MSVKSKSKGKKSPAPKKSRPKATKAKKVVKPVAAEEKPKALPKEKKVIEKKEDPPKPVVKAPSVELGPVPSARVEARHIDSSRERAARGFSFGELESAGVPLEAARREGLSLDLRRRSVVGGNVDSLKGWFKGSEGPKKQATVAPVVKKK